MSAPVGSESSLDGVNIVSNDKEHGNSMDIDLSHYHEQHAGRLVLDPRYVGIFHIFLWHIPFVLFLITHAPERLALSLETILHHDSSFRRTERSSSGPSHQMTRKTLKTSVHASKVSLTTVSLTSFHPVVRVAEDSAIANHHSRCGCPRFRFGHW
jgi:hypothetical protein